MSGDLAGPRKPDAVGIPVRDTMTQCFTDRIYAEGLPSHVRVQPQRKNQGLLFALIDHDIKLIHDHVGELARAMTAVQQSGDIIQFKRIRYRQ